MIKKEGEITLKVIHSLLKTKLSSVEEKIDDLAGRMSKLEKRVEKLETSISKLENKVEKLEVSLSKLEKRVEKLEISLSKLELVVSRLKISSDFTKGSVIAMNEKFENEFQKVYLYTNNQLNTLAMDLSSNNFDISRIKTRLKIKDEDPSLKYLKKVKTTQSK